VAEFAAGAVQPGHDGAERGAHDLGDLAVRVTLDVSQVDGGAELGRKRAQRRDDVGVGHLVKRLGFG
jgi:hypothetical protein